MKNLLVDASKQRFNSGVVYTTPTINELFSGEKLPHLLELIKRHVCGDYGVLACADVISNEKAIRCGLMVMSNYDVRDLNLGISNVWIITEGDRSSTTVLLPEEY